MDSLPADWSALLGLVFALGLRHGVDADHVATIDALTRLSHRPRRARWCGTLFAAGHGVAVLALVSGVALASHGWQPPRWLAPLGACLSMTLLVLLGLGSLRAGLRAAPGEVVRLGGLRGRLFGRWLHGGHPGTVAGIGALFALSFDTVSLGVMFAMAGHAAGGAGHALVLGLAFAAGMTLTDGANGLWLAHLLGRGDAAAARASRATALVVGGASLAVAAVGRRRLGSPALDQWAEDAGLWLGAGLLGLVLLVCAATAARRRTARSGRVASGGPVVA